LFRVAELRAREFGLAVKARRGRFYVGAPPFRKDAAVESTRINIPDGKSSNLAFASRDYGAN
jgi:hypothetical protein